MINEIWLKDVTCMGAAALVPPIDSMVWLEVGVEVALALSLLVAVGTEESAEIVGLAALPEVLALVVAMTPTSLLMLVSAFCGLANAPVVVKTSIQTNKKRACKATRRWARLDMEETRMLDNGKNTRRKSKNRLPLRSFVAYDGDVCCSCC
jgi:hypothetical protein